MDELEYNLRPLWEVLLGIYKEVKTICDCHSLRFYACGGTAIGAVRHKGFVPWDDDMDLIMPREDYILFFERYSKELPSYLKAEDFRSKEKRESSIVLPFGKVYDLSPELVERLRSETRLKLEHGVFIDIIPIDGMPRNRIPFERWFLCFRMWRFALVPANRRWKIPVHKIVRMLLGIREGHECDNHLKFERWLRKWNFDTSPSAEDINATLSRRIKHPMNSSTYGAGRLISFENVEMRIADDFELYLATTVGNWRELPPIESRHPSHQIIK